MVYFSPEKFLYIADVLSISISSEQNSGMEGGRETIAYQ